MVPPEEGVDRFIGKEDEDTPLSILLSGIRGIIVTEADIAMLHREMTAVDGKNPPAP